MEYILTHLLSLLPQLSLIDLIHFGLANIEILFSHLLSPLSFPDFAEPFHFAGANVDLGRFSGSEKIVDSLIKLRLDVGEIVAKNYSKFTIPLGALFCFIYITIKALGRIAQPDGDQEPVSKMLMKPLFILIAIILYVPAMNFVNDGLGLFNIKIDHKDLQLNENNRKRINELIKDQNYYYQQLQALKEMEEKDRGTYYDEFRGEIEAELDSIDEILENSDPLTVTAGKESMEWSTGGVFMRGALGWISEVIMTIMLFLQFISLTLLHGGGPFSLVISLIPGFENSAKKWFATYVTVYMWLPIMNLIDALILVLQDKIGAGETGTMLGTCSLGVYVVSYFLIPKFTSWFVASRESGEAMSAAAVGAASIAKSAVGGGMNAPGKLGNLFGKGKNMMGGGGRSSAGE